MVRDKFVRFLLVLVFLISWLTSFILSGAQHNILDDLFEFLLAKADFFKGCRILWVGSYILPKVKNQGKPGCCYAFATCDCVASLIALMRPLRVLLAPQELVDFMVRGGSEGGKAKDAYRYIKEHGIVEEHVYPYKGRKRRGKGKRPVGRRFFIRGHETKQEHYFEFDTEQHLKMRPFTVSFSCDKDIRLYDPRGIYDLPERVETLERHSALVVGWGIDSVTGVEYFVIKNNHGRGWGFWGYGRIATSLCFDFEFPLWDGQQWVHT